MSLYVQIHHGVKFVNSCSFGTCLESGVSRTLNRTLSKLDTFPSGTRPKNTLSTFLKPNSNALPSKIMIKVRGIPHILTILEKISLSKHSKQFETSLSFSINSEIFTLFEQFRNFRNVSNFQSTVISYVSRNPQSLRKASAPQSRAVPKDSSLETLSR